MPAKVIGMRFPKSIADKLLSIDFKKITKDNLKEHLELLRIHLDENNVDEIVKKINNL